MLTRALAAVTAADLPVLDREHLDRALALVLGPPVDLPGAAPEEDTMRALEALALAATRAVVYYHARDRRHREHHRAVGDAELACTDLRRRLSYTYPAAARLSW